MGLRSVVRFVSFPVRFAWKHKNKFLPERTTRMEKPVIIKEHQKAAHKKEHEAAHHIKTAPVEIPLSEQIVQHVRVDFKQHAPAENVFYLHNGKMLRSIDELAMELLVMDNDTFSHHVNHERNDFANWIEGVFKAKELASELREEHDIHRTMQILERHRL